ncbi:hypothetical protein BGZ72_002784, partial [Mortierella alpina]
RQAQELIGGFVQRVVVEGHEVSGEDRELLDAICPRLAKPEPGSNDGNDVSDDAEEDEDDKSLQYQFLSKLLGHLFSGNVRNDNATGRLLQRFINRASGFNLCKPYSISPTRHQPPFPASVLWSVTKELAKEIKMLYKGGCENIQKQLEAKVQREELPRSALEADFTQPTIVNFVRLNKLYNSTYTLASHSGPTQSFVLLSELDLLDIFWKNKALKERIMEIFGMSTASKDMAAARLSTNGPGFLLNQLVTRKGTGGQRRGFGSYQKSAKSFSIEDMQDHLADLWSLDFRNNPTTYNGRGYMLTGSIRTDGFSLQLLALKLKECSSVKYKRLPEDVALPPRMLSVLSGIDDHLTEIRHVPLLQLLDMSRADVKEHG